MAARLDSQHTEARLGIVEGDPLDDAGEHFPVGLIRSRRCSHSLEYPRGRGSLAKAVRMATVSASLGPSRESDQNGRLSSSGDKPAFGEQFGGTFRSPNPKPVAR